MVLGFVWWDQRDVRHGPGVTAPGPPSQESAGDAAPFELDEFRLVPRARFEIEARVLGKEPYWIGREARLSPYDLALGWGHMSDEDVLQEFSISQSRRFYWWSSRTLPIPRRAVIRQSANMHIIPADDAVHDELGRIREGHVIHARGYLVDITARDGWRWRTSTTRDDTGAGSCEILWAEEISIVER